MFENLLRGIPVSVNNFYGDPTLQWADTCRILADLAESGHTGPVGVITKGKLSPAMVNNLVGFRQAGLSVVVFVSISELPDFEKVGHAHRYANIGRLTEAGIPNVAYIRPLTPPYNTSAEVIGKIYRQLAEVGGKTVCASGFRGDDALVADMNPDQVCAWTMRVKLMTGDVYAALRGNADHYGMKLFTRTSCAVSYVLGHEADYNPYYNSPNLAKCSTCPLRATCKPPARPRPGSLEFLRYLGYEPEFISGAGQVCNVQPDKRLSCPSCCTTCYILNTSRILIPNAQRLGDLTFARFITGMLCMNPGMVDGGDKDVGYVSFPHFPQVDGIQCLNSWWPIATLLGYCYDCTYCVEKYYGSDRPHFGFSPARLLERLG